MKYDYLVVGAGLYLSLIHICNAYGTAPHERLELFEARLYQYPQCDCMRCDFHYPGRCV